MELTPADVELIEKTKESFTEFIRYIFPLSYKDYREASHLYLWSQRIQSSKKTATLSARKHLKSTLMYAYLMWRIFRMKDSEEWLYMSYTEPLSRYHTRNIKRLINQNPLFRGIEDLTAAESTLRYSWNNLIFSVIPASILRFNRGWHGDGVICDDILADPTNELNLTIISSITNTFFEEVLSLPVEGGELHLVGTPQHQEDLFFQIREKSKSFDWGSYPALIDEADKKTLWPKMFNYERLAEIRDNEIGNKAFMKEYMCSPLWSEEAYFKREQIMQIVDSGLINLKHVEKQEATVIAGYDIGKMQHPSHFAVFLHSKGLIIQIHSLWMDGWDYTKQIGHIINLIDQLKIKAIYFDNTRGELESFFEQGIIRKGLWHPIVFSQKEKGRIAGAFSQYVEKGIIRLINDSRMIRSILSVNNNLEALETPEGHGDAFWSIAMALSHRITPALAIAGFKRYD